MEEVFVLEDVLAMLAIMAAGVLVVYVGLRMFLPMIKAWAGRARLGWHLSSPEDRLAAAIGHREERIGALEAKVAAIRAKHDRLEADAADAHNDVVKWTMLESIVVPSPNMQDADKDRAVAHRMDAEFRERSLLALVEASSITIKAAEAMILAAKARLQMARNTQATLEVRMAAADIRKDLADELDPDGTMAALSDMEDEALAKEGMAQAYEETGEFGRDVLDAQRHRDRPDPRKDKA